MPRMRILIFVLTLILPALAGAQSPTANATGLTSADSALGNPYQGQVPVADQTPASRDGALADALRQVIGRVSGAANVDAATPLIAEAAQLVQRYGYTRDANGGLMLQAAFDSHAIDNRLRALGLPVWGVYAADVEELRLVINGVDGADAYIRVMSELQHLPGVESVSAIRAQGQQLSLRVRAEGGAGRLSGALMAGGRFWPDNSVTPGSAPGELVYRLVPTGAP